MSERERTDADADLEFDFFEDLPTTEGAGRQPPPPPPKKSKGPPSVKGGRSMLVACFAEDPREPDFIGEANVDLTEVLTKGETDGASFLESTIASI